jgi:multimeric flavodoxin WrbA
MKVLLINGSPNAKGCTFTGLSIIKEQLAKHDVDSEIFQVGNKPVIGCVACRACKQEGKKGRCVFDNDIVNTVSKALNEADGMIIGSAVHFAGATGAVTSFCDRLFFSRLGMNRLKFGACIVSCRRSGSTATFDQLNKYFSISQMPIVSSSYWNNIHGNTPEEVLSDEEGIRTLKVLADNMAYLIKCKHQSNIDLPELPPPVSTNFIR